MRVVQSKSCVDNIKWCGDLGCDEVGIITTEGPFAGCVVILPYGKAQLVCIGNISNSDKNNNCKTTWGPALPTFKVRVVKAHIVIEE
jgi:hypothetical protein